MRFSLDFALLLIDDFSGRTLAGPGCRFTVAGRRAFPQRKEEGYYVFAALGEEPPYEVEISRPGYCARRLTAAAPGAVIEARLLREDAPFPDCSFVRGVYRPDAPVLALPRAGGKLLALAKDARGDRVFLAGYERINLTRLRLCVGAGAGREVFLMAARGEDGGYTADRCFRYPHAAGEPVRRAYCGVCGKDGSYHIPVDAGDIEEILTDGEGIEAWDCWSRAGPS